MNYVVVDLEWNQAMSSKSSVFNKLPIRLGGEIIEIGAVKLTEDMQPGEEFTVDVKPVYFRRMHYKVKKITGFDKERLAHGIAFAEIDGELMQYEAEGDLLAVCLQHEIDHVHGITMVDHLSPMKKVKALRAYNEALANGARPGDVAE